MCECIGNAKKERNGEEGGYTFCLSRSALKVSTSTIKLWTVEFYSFLTGVTSMNVSFLLLD